MRKRKTSYPLAIFLNMLSLLLFMAAIFYRIYIFLSPESVGWDFGFEGKESFIGTIILIVSGLQYLLLRIPLKKMLNKAVLDNEYDEFGMSKKKKFENLTRKEREEIDLMKAAQMESLLSSSVLKKIKKQGSKNPEKDLNEMIGLEDVKTKIREMAARMKFEKASGKKKSEYGFNGRHFCFYGSAGTGKTTAARIIAGFLYKQGYIKENKVIEINGGFLKAGEDSETKTKLVLQQAYGGVLFVDEAYSIVEGNAAYGRAVIAELIKQMEDNRDKLTIIIAGYKKDMKRLLDENEGFKSRIKEYIEFKDYDLSELKMIFESMAHEAGFVVSADAMENFEIRISKEKALPSFGNGRTVRNVLDETLDHHALNFGNGTLSKDEKFLLCGCDVSTKPNTKVL